ncbi:MAG: peptide deformylase [Opitutales bacterium]
MAEFFEKSLKGKLDSLGVSKRDRKLTICQYGDPILHEPGRDIERFDENLVVFSLKVLLAMAKAGGIGLAAQQVGIAKRICVVYIPELRYYDYYSEEDNFDEAGAKADEGFRPPAPQCFYDGKLINPEELGIMILVNPEIEKISTEEKTGMEGCLSFHEIRGGVSRPQEIRVRFQDIFGAIHTLECKGQLARCIQHEVDHLNGTLFIDRMDEDYLKTIQHELESLKKNNRQVFKKNRPRVNF